MNGFIGGFCEIKIWEETYLKISEEPAEKIKNVTVTGASLKFHLLNALSKDPR
jgi:hypothetical protein